MPQLPHEPLPPPPAPGLGPTVAYWRSPPGKRWAARLVFGGGVGGFAIMLLLARAPWWLTAGTAVMAAFAQFQAERERLLVGENWISEGGRRYVRLDQLKKVTTSIGGNASTWLHLTDYNRRSVSFCVDEIEREAPTILRVVMRAVAEAAARDDLQLSPGVESLVRQYYRPRKRKRRGAAASPGPVGRVQAEMAAAGSVWSEMVPGAVAARVRLDGAEVRGYGVGAAVHTMTAGGGRLGWFVSLLRGWLAPPLMACPVSPRPRSAGLRIAPGPRRTSLPATCRRRR